nr:MAG TPA: hypothetical protein [Bacteriophage sp.]
MISKREIAARFRLGDVLQHVMSYEFETLPVFSLIS